MSLMASPVIESTNESNNTNVFIKPTGLADGDVLFVLYGWANESGSGTPSLTGFTAVQNAVYAGAGYDLGCAIFRKVISSAAGEPANYTVTRTPTPFFDGGEILRVSGADTTTPEDDSGNNNGNSTSATTGAVIDTTGDSLLLMLGYGDGADLGTPAGMSALFNLDTSDLSGWSQSVTGALSGATRSSALSSAHWNVAWCAVKAAGGGGTKGRIFRRPTRTWVRRY